MGRSWSNIRDAKNDKTNLLILIRYHLPIEYLVKCGRLFQILGGIMKGRPFFNMGGIKNTVDTVILPAWIKKNGK